MTKMTIPYGDQVDLNIVDQVFSDTKFGINRAVATALETIMVNGGLYPDAGVETLYVSSDSGSDVLVQASAVGIDSDGIPLRQTVTTNGQAGVILPVDYWKGLSRGFIAGSVDPIGNIYFGTEASPSGGIPALANQRAFIEAGAGQTQMARLVVPKQLAIIIKPSFVSVTRNDDAELSLWVRLDGGIWRNQTPMNLFQAAPQMNLKYSFPELAEIEYRGIAGASISNISAAFGYKMFNVTEAQQQQIAEGLGRM